MTLTRVSDSQRARAAKEWSNYAGEKMRVTGELIDGPIYAYGSELGCLRLYYRMKAGRVAKVNGKNGVSWYYCNK